MSSRRVLSAKRRRLAKLSNSSVSEAQEKNRSAVRGPNQAEAIRSNPVKALPDIALAAIFPAHDQKQVDGFITYFLEALERNCHWINDALEKSNNFRCAMMVGAGPNRFQVHEIIYPNSNEDINLEVELRDLEDYDKIAMAALLNLGSWESSHILDFIKMRQNENTTLQQDLLTGKSMGVQYAVLKPIDDKQFHIMERIVVGNPKKPFK